MRDRVEKALNAVQNGEKERVNSLLIKKSAFYIIAVVVLCVAVAGCIFVAPESESFHMELPFDAEDISSIEICHTEGKDLPIEKVTVPKGEDADSLYNLLKTIPLEKVDMLEVEGVAESGIRFNLSDGREYEMAYVCVGAKNGYLYDISRKQMYFTSADIGNICYNLIKFRNH